jgi:hypothetical protein
LIRSTPLVVVEGTLRKLRSDPLALGSFVVVQIFNHRIPDNIRFGDRAASVADRCYIFREPFLQSSSTPTAQSPI